MQNPVGWFEIYVSDMARAKSFYQTVLSVKLENLGDPTDGGAELWAFPSSFENYGAAGALVKMEGFKAGVGGTLVYFSCDDCALQESKVKAAGGQVQQAKFSLGEHGFCALVLDTEGNMIGLHSQK